MIIKIIIPEYFSLKYKSLNYIKDIFTINYFILFLLTIYFINNFFYILEYHIYFFFILFYYFHVVFYIFMYESFMYFIIVYLFMCNFSCSYNILFTVGIDSFHRMYLFKFYSNTLIIIRLSLAICQRVELF